MFVSPSPWREHPFRRKKRRSGIERMLAHKRGGFFIRIHLHLEGWPLEINPDLFRVTRGKIEMSRPGSFYEYGITTGRKIEGRINRRGGFHNHVHLLAAKVHRLLDAGGP